ncbi:MAG: hypothetical protein OEZ22_15005 [Spirochaetia bacterium]|nr:hypothetical protein [Spirochaetia bacterium]
MSVEENADFFIVTFTDDKDEKTISRLGKNARLLEVKYYDKNNQEYMTVSFNHEKKIITSTGLVNEEYDLEENAYDGTGAVFFIFSKILPPVNKTIILNILQSKDERITAMYLKYINKEEIYVNGSLKKAVKYETGVESSVLSLIWPYKYYYWYSEETNEFLRYEGPFGHENNEVIEVF